jgi:hypothetical protein
MYYQNVICFKFNEKRCPGLHTLSTFPDSEVSNTSVNTDSFHNISVHITVQTEVKKWKATL